MLFSKTQAKIRRFQPLVDTKQLATTPYIHLYTWCPLIIASRKRDARSNLLIAANLEEALFGRRHLASQSKKSPWIKFSSLTSRAWNIPRIPAFGSRGESQVGDRYGMSKTIPNNHVNSEGDSRLQRRWNWADSSFKCPGQASNRVVTA